MQIAAHADVLRAYEAPFESPPLVPFSNGDAAKPISLGKLIVHQGARTLLRDGMPVEIGSRAFDILITLLNAGGQVVSKDAIMKAVWPNVTVEEANLRVQLGHVRQALGDERWRIKTIPCRGYVLVVDTPTAEPPQPPALTGLAVVFIDADVEGREYLRHMLVSAGVRVENLGSLAAALGSVGAEAN